MSEESQPKHDPWLVFLDRWALRILKIGCVTCVLIFVVKIILHELGYGPENSSHDRPDTPAAEKP